METIGQKLAKIRKSAALSQKELSSLVGRSSSYISRVESGEREHTPALVVDWLKVCKSRIKWTEKEYLENLKELQEYQHPNMVKNSRILAQDFFAENYVYNSNEFKEAFESAQEISVLGMGQARMIISYSGAVRQILSKGGKVHFILCDPYSAAVEMASKIEFSGLDKELIIKEHWSAIDRLISISKEPNSTGELNIKLINFLPAFTLYGFDLHVIEKAKLYIWISAFKESSNKRPGFVLLSQDKIWFDFFVSQFNHFWNWEEATTIKISDENYRLAFER